MIRLFQVALIFIRYRLDRNLPTEAIPWWAAPLFWILKLWPCRIPPAEATRLAIESLGPIFIKFGQLLSTRRDLFDDEMGLELEKLQDQVPPFDPETAQNIIETSIGGPVENYFKDFSAEVLASASVAQVHAATLLSNDEPIVIKVIRPGIDTVIRKDLALMYRVAHLLEKFWSESERLHPVAIVSDYEKTILGELDLSLEARNTETLRSIWKDSGKLYVPAVYESLSSKNVMVMERIYGVPANNVEYLKSQNVNLKKLAHLGVEIFFTQVFEDNFFHADMHPGNVFLDISDPENPSYIALDCAIIGSLTENDKDYLARNIYAFFNRDYDEVARLHVQSGWVPVDTDVNEFATVIRRVCDPFFQKPISEISFGTVLLELFQTARQFNMEVQPQLVLLQKTLINIEGMGRQIYGDLDLWETAAPFMEKWMDERIGITGLIRKVSQNAPRWLEQLPELPDLAYGALADLRQMTAQYQQQSLTLSEVKDTLERQERRSKYQRMGGIALVGAVLSFLFPLSGYAAPIDPLVPGSVLGTLGIYWMYIHS